MSMYVCVCMGVRMRNVWRCVHDGEEREIGSNVTTGCWLP